jgi:hypothetical protein
VQVVHHHGHQFGKRANPNRGVHGRLKADALVVCVKLAKVAR